MEKHIHRWKPVRLMTNCGCEYIDDELASVVAKFYNGELVERILSMDRKKPVSFHQALFLASEEFGRALSEGRRGRKKNESSWYFRNLLDFISEEGYHIELTGDEFESPASNSN